MTRVAIIGNSGGGKSVLGRRVAGELGLPCVEVDAILWLPGWQLAAAEDYDRAHAQLIAGDAWVIEGLGRKESLPARLQRATAIVLVDMPLWVHFWLAAERHGAWVAGRLRHPPAGSKQPAPLQGLFKTIWEVDREWMPALRQLVDGEERCGKRVFRLATFEDLNSFLPSALGSS